MSRFFRVILLTVRFTCRSLTPFFPKTCTGLPSFYSSQWTNLDHHVECQSPLSRCPWPRVPRMLRTDVQVTLHAQRCYKAMHRLPATTCGFLSISGKTLHHRKLYLDEAWDAIQQSTTNEAIAYNKKTCTTDLKALLMSQSCVGLMFWGCFFLKKRHFLFA